MDRIPRDIWRNDAGVTGEKTVAWLLRMQPGERASPAKKHGFQEAERVRKSRD